MIEIINNPQIKKREIVLNKLILYFLIKNTRVRLFSYF